MVKRLSDLGDGESGIVVDLEDSNNHFCFSELGFVPGTRVECVRLASPKGPFLLRLRGYCLSLEHSDAAGIWVDV
ncbi:MAG: ferrous iron transport protein A [Puniceicoccales bacterium]|jgi:Fe2+ transport system protein FeoA|nr:ferrous iron transport protein A [Puniceicoccales bacterium]